MNTLKVGIIGTGVGVRTHLPGFRATGKADVIGICGSSPERTKIVAAANDIPRAYDSYAALCGDDSLDLICIASPNEFHFEHYKAAVESGKHVLIEKPVTTNSNEMRKFLSLRKKQQNQLILVNHQLRFNPYLSAISKAIQAGEIGRPYFVHIHQQGTGFFSPDTPYSWLFDAQRGGGVRLAMGTHLVDLLHTFLGNQSIDAVTGSLDTIYPSRLDITGLRHPVTACGNFAAFLRSGHTTAMLSASAAAQSDRFDIEVLGTDGQIYFDLEKKVRMYFRNGRARLIHAPSNATADEVKNTKSIFRTSFVYYANAIVTAVLENDERALQSACTLEQAGSTIEVLDALLNSATSEDISNLRKATLTNAQS